MISTTLGTLLLTFTLGAPSCAPKNFDSATCEQVIDFETDNNVLTRTDSAKIQRKKGFFFDELLPVISMMSPISDELKAEINRNLIKNAVPTGISIFPNEQ